MRINFRINTVFAISAVFLFAFVLNGCKDPIVKDSSLVNGPNDFLNLNTTDTFTVNSKTIADLPYSAAGVSNGIVGSMDDPIFGKVVCGFYTQCRLSKDGSVFSDNPVVDSCVLSLYYYDSYGKNTKPVNIAVYEVTESIDPLNTSYLTNSTFSVNGSPIGVAYNFVPNYTDSVKTISGTEAPQMRIKLNNAFGQRVLNMDSATLSNNTNFLNLIKGIYVTAQGALGNGVSNVSLTDSKVAIYYHNNTNDSLQFNLNISTSSARINHFDHIYSGIIQQALASTAVSDSLLYVQSGAGTKVKVTFPTLLDLPENLAINKAELIVTKWNDVSGLDTSYPLPSFIYLSKINASGADESFSAFDNNGLATNVTRTESGVDYTSYTFNITQHMQGVVKGNYPNNGFHISLSSASKSDRLILTNFKSDNKFRIRLKLTFTKLS
ncbi:MAG: DUF4270 domain-containing protein [Chitinophagales bacterium]|nr:DUF4270 domain-containing protein [Chitinophagales bacterium]